MGVRHAISRALATANLTPFEATFRVVSAAVRLDERDRVVRGEATLDIYKPVPLADWGPERLLGMVNPDGQHPLMVLVPGGAPFFLDVFPVTWNRWLRRVEDTLPPVLDPLCPRVDVSHTQVVAFAELVGKRLPTAAELRQAWGPEYFPWGPRPNPARGRVGAPRFGELPEVGLHPPSRLGLLDLGAWLWHWTAEGTVSCGAIDYETAHDVVPGEYHVPLGFRLAQDA